jgi:predicted phage terminase large subunit-like protein
MTFHLDAATVYGFQGAMLSARYDEAKPTPDFHFELWELACSLDPRVAVAAPRHHAKSTAVTHAYVLASVLFKVKQNVMILSDTQEQSEQFLHDIKVELEENKELREEFGVVRFVRERDNELIVELSDGHKFRIFAKGTSQSLRGSKWRGKRPDLIICDDMENDEMVMNKERRAKIKKWFLSTLLPILSDTGQIRVVGTILHADGLLEWLLQSNYWTTRRYEAHDAEFKNILWPEKWPEKKLRELSAVYAEAGENEIYLQEFRNIPIDDSIALFRKADFKKITDKDEFLEYYIGVDCAISEKTTADWTVFAVVGINKAGRLKVVDIARDRMDSLAIVDMFFELEQAYHPQCFVVEDENISKAVGPFLFEQMPRRNIWPVIETLTTGNKDLVRRSSSFRARMRAGGVEFDHEAEWYPGLCEELTLFNRGKNDDQVSSLSLVGMWLARMTDAEERTSDDDEEDESFFSDEDEYDEDVFEYGRNATTGY